jgi:hypothetical protein
LLQLERQQQQEKQQMAEKEALEQLQKEGSSYDQCDQAFVT